MRMPDRDRQIILSIGRFGQLATAHIASLHFDGLASSTPLYRALDRLDESQYVRKLERRMVGGSGAGSGQYVYQLGPKGWQLAGKDGRYWPYRAVNFHTLAIADVYVELLGLERDGRIELKGVSTEPDSWLDIAGSDLRPDIHVDIADIHRRRDLALWIEIDLGSERQKAIKDKLARYFHAYRHADSRTLPIFPLVLFIAPDDERAKELRWIIGKGDPEAQALFMVSTMGAFAGMLFG